MDALKNTLNSVRLAVLDRVGNPLVGSFFLAWAVWNFRLLMVIFGDGPWKEKIEYIDQGLMPSRLDWLLHGYLAPLVFALIWVFFLPWVFRKVQVYHYKQLAKTAQAVMLAQDKQPIDEEIVTQLRRRFRDTEDSWKKERAQYEEIIAEYMGRLKQSQTQLETQSQHAQAVGEKQVEIDPILSVMDSKKIGIDGKPMWIPRKFDEADLKHLPFNMRKKVQDYPFTKNEVQALVAMRNSDEVDADFLVKTLGVERFDANNVLDSLFTLMLISPSGVAGKFTLNADGRILTAFFKKVLGESSTA